MADKTQALFTEQPAGQPGNASPSQGEPAQSSQAQDFQKMLSDALADQEKRILRQVQSMGDKQANQIKKALADVERSKGGPLTEEERQAATLAAKALVSNAEPEPEPQTPAPATPSPASPGQVKAGGEAASPAAWKTTVYESIVEELPDNEWLSVDDPEYKAINDGITSKAEFRKAVEKAIADKRVRLQSGAAARMPALPSSGPTSNNPIANITDPQELLAMGLNPRR